MKVRQQIWLPVAAVLRQELGGKDLGGEKKALLEASWRVTANPKNI